MSQTLWLFLWLVILQVGPVLSFAPGRVGTRSVHRQVVTSILLNQPRQSHHYSSTRLSLMKATIRIVGRKPSDGSSAWLEQGVAMYTQRLARVLTLSTAWTKSNEALLPQIQADADKGHTIVVLDPTVGTQYSSEQFADHFYRWMERGGSRVVFVIGGAEGLPDSVRDCSQYNKVSLSKMTFTHQFARLLLAEQIYRAYEIRRGSDYHK